MPPKVTTFLRPPSTDADLNYKVNKLANTIFKQPRVRYLAYLASPRWQQIRREHLEFADYWCELCKKERACQVHHWTYVRLGYEHPNDLSAVCVTCHHRIHCAVMPEPANDNQLLLFDQEDDKREA